MAFTLAEQDTHLHVLRRATTLALAEHETVDEFLTQLINVIQELGYAHFGIGLADESGQVVYRAGYGIPRDRASQLSSMAGEGIVGWVFAHGKPRLVQDVSREPLYLQIRSTTRSEVCVPLRTHRQIIGAINVESDRLEAFTSHDLEILTTLADVISGPLARMLRREQTAPRAAQKVSSLTARERQVLREVVAGKSNKEIARELKIKESTVETHLTHIFTELGVRSRVKAALWAREHSVFGREKG